jgi:hypothetical protein
MPDIAAKGDTVSDWTTLETSLKQWWTGRVPYETINATWLRLRPFISWCAKHGIGAAEVCDATVENFIRDTDRPSQSERYRRREQRLRQAWNLAAAKAQGWPPITLSVQPSRDGLRAPTRKAGHIVSFGRPECHPNLVAEVERYCSNGGFLSPSEREGAPGISFREKVVNRLKQLNSAVATDKVLAWPDRRVSAGVILPRSDEVKFPR